MPRTLPSTANIEYKSNLKYLHNIYVISTGQVPGELRAAADLHLHVPGHGAARAARVGPGAVHGEDKSGEALCY